MDVLYSSTNIIRVIKTTALGGARNKYGEEKCIQGSRRET